MAGPAWAMAGVAIETMSTAAISSASVANTWPPQRGGQRLGVHRVVVVDADQGHPGIAAYFCAW